jgi:hypothetical protein
MFTRRTFYAAALIIQLTSLARASDPFFECLDTIAIPKLHKLSQGRADPYLHWQDHDIALKYAWNSCIERFPERSTAQDYRYADIRMRDLINKENETSLDGQQKERAKQRQAEAPRLQAEEDHIMSLYKDCLLSATRVIAVRSAEPADTIATAAFAACASNRSDVLALKDGEGTSVLDYQVMDVFERAFRPQLVLEAIKQRALEPAPDLARPTPEGQPLLSPKGAHAAEISVIQPGHDTLGPIISLRGPIGDGDFARVKKAIGDWQHVSVALDSDGGLVVDAMQIGELLREREAVAFIMDGSRCASACALIFVGAAKRAMQAHGLLGAHAVYDVDPSIPNGVPKIDSAMNAVVGAYLSKLGYGYATVATMTRAAPDGMKWFDPAEARAAGIPVETIGDRGETIVDENGTPPSAMSAPAVPMIASAPPAAVPAARSPTAEHCVVFLGGEPTPCPPGLRADSFCTEVPKGQICRVPPADAGAIELAPMAGGGGPLPGSFLLVPGDLQATISFWSDDDISPSYSRGAITEADVDAYCAALARDATKCRANNARNIGAPVYAEADCATKAQAYYFRDKRRAWRDADGALHVDNFGLDAAVRLLAAQRAMLCMDR